MSSLNIASNALTTNMAALQVIGHNIANVNTPGFSRQTVELQSAGSQLLGNGYFGKGVSIAAVDRAYSSYLSREAQLTKSVADSDAARFQRLEQLEQLFPMGETGLGASLNDALNAWVDVASSPTDLTARTVTLSRADELAARLRDTSSRLDELRLSSTLQVDSIVDSINGLADQIASLNNRIIAAQGGSASPNDLLDQRDQLVLQLNQYVQTSSVPATDGSISVFVGGSQPLVVGAKSSHLVSGKDALDPALVRISIVQSNATFGINESFLGGGELKGLLNFINEDIPDTQNTLGRLALSLAAQVNEQHHLGLDLDGNAGGNFFSMQGNNLALAPDGTVTINAVAPDTSSTQANTGTGAVQAVLADPQALIASNYEVRFSSSSTGIVVRLSDGQTTDFDLTASPTVSVDGLDISLASGTPQANDRFLLKPFAETARNLDVALSSPRSLAAASPLVVDVGATNAGGLGLENISATAQGPYTPYELRYNAATGNFDVFDASDPDPANWTTQVASLGPYSPGEPFEYGGWRIQLSGVPADGDSLVIRPPVAGESMNQSSGNAKAILGLRDVDSFQGVSLGDGYISVFSGVAAKVQAGKFQAEFSEATAVSAETARANVSGVNLDEEASRMLQYQQSYQAAAKYLQVAQGTFDTLMQVFR
ncbi:MAG TPA: flagellar hook-associated protein FlgK [Macromonas sp.]|nr:flagellar hook-associated protein FlgK [Macromonas sp.]